MAAAPPRVERTRSEASLGSPHSTRSPRKEETTDNTKEVVPFDRPDAIAASWYSKAVAGAVKETSQGTFAKGVDTKWPETQTVAKGVTSLLPRKSDEIFNFKPPPRRQETVSVPPRG